MNSSYEVQIRKDDNEFYKCKSNIGCERRTMMKYWKLPNGNYIVKIIKDDGFDGNNDIKNTMPSHLGAFILSNNKRNLNNYTREFNGHYNHAVHYGDTDSIFVKKDNGMC